MRARCCHCAIKWVADHESLRVCGWALELLIHPKWVKSILRIRVLGLNATEKYLPKISINKLCFAVLDLANVNADAISPVCICKLVFVEEEAEAEFPAIGTVAEPVASTDKPDAYLFAMLFLFLFAPNWCVSVRLTMWRWANDNTISEQWIRAIWDTGPSCIIRNYKRRDWTPWATQIARLSSDVKNDCVIVFACVLL